MKYATTDKLNDSMKAKVFKYRSDGNTVVAPYMELEPYAENVYLSLSRKNEYGNEDDDCFHVVCRIENVYFSSGQYSRRFLNGENRRDETAAYCRNWIADTLQGAERGAFVRLISVRVFEALGLDAIVYSFSLSLEFQINTKFYRFRLHHLCIIQSLRHFAVRVREFRV